MKPSASSAGWLTGNLLSENDPAFRQIVWRHFHVDTIADDRSDAVATHLAGRVGNDPEIIFEHHSKPSIGQNLVDDAFDGQQLFFRQCLNSGRKRSWLVLVRAPPAALERRLAINVVDHEPEPRAEAVNVAVSGSHGNPFEHEG